MKTLNVLTSACRYCQYYKPEGRRGGMCQQLGVPVQGSWKACALAMPKFAPSWEGLQGIMILPDEKPVLPSSGPLVSALEGSGLDPTEQTAGSTPDRKKAQPLLV